MRLNFLFEIGELNWLKKKEIIEKKIQARHAEKQLSKPGLDKSKSCGDHEKQNVISYLIDSVENFKAPYTTHLNTWVARFAIAVQFDIFWSFQLLSSKSLVMTFNGTWLSDISPALL